MCSLHHIRVQFDIAPQIKFNTSSWCQMRQTVSESMFFFSKLMKIFHDSLVFFSPNSFWSPRSACAKVCSSVLSLPCFGDGSDDILTYLYVELSHETSHGRQWWLSLDHGFNDKDSLLQLISLWAPVKVVVAKLWVTEADRRYSFRFIRGRCICETTHV